MPFEEYFRFPEEKKYPLIFFFTVLSPLLRLLRAAEPSERHGTQRLHSGAPPPRVGSRRRRRRDLREEERRCGGGDQRIRSDSPELKGAQEAPEKSPE